jgi:hypothetical protein
MRFSTLTGAAALSAAAMAAEMPVDEFRAAELYDSGLMHQKVMEKKIVRQPAPLPTLHSPVSLVLTR